MDRVISKDGVSVAYARGGEGDPLVLIHGTAADHTRWTPILSELKRHFTVYAVDRRGRGESGDAEPYTIDREYEDVSAIVDSIPGPVNILGHSYGAICSLEASLKLTKLRKLILYEPPIPIGDEERYPPDTIDRMNVCLRSKEHEKALLIFLQEVTAIPKNEITMLRSLPSWSSRVATARTIAREEGSVCSYRFNPHRFSRLSAPTLLLLGGDSPLFYRVAIEVLGKSIRNSRIAIMPGQRHAAMETAPDLFLKEVIGFLTEKKE